MNTQPAAAVTYGATPRERCGALFIGLLLALACAAPAAAHTRLERSSPSAGDTLQVAPFELRLVFSQAVAPRYTTLVLRGPDGAIIPTPALLADATRREYVAMAPHFAAAGRYTIEWRTTAADGHVISGSFDFLFAGGALPSDSATPAAAADAARAPASHDDPHAHHVDESLLPAHLRPSSWQNTVARALQFAGLIGIIGLAAFRLLVLPAMPADPADAALRASLRRFGAAALTLFVLTLPVRLWLQSAALHGPDLALERGLVGSLLVDLNWGRAWLLQLAAAGFAAIAVVTGFTPLLVIAATALAVAPALQGHAAGSEHNVALAIAGDVIHVLAAGAWVGALAVLLLAAFPAIWRHGGDGRARSFAALVERFSPLALAAAALLAVTGLLGAWLHLRHPADLFASEYGRMLLIKLACVALVLGTGWYNWKRSRPRLGAEEGSLALFNAATLEVLFAGGAIAATAALVALPTP